MKTILIVEDVEEMRLMLEQLIQGMTQFRLSGSCANATEARLELTRRRPSLVLLDEILPGESSLDLLDECVSQEIPVVLTTGMERPEHPIPEGALGRVIKPDWRSLDQARSRIEKELLAALDACKENC